jgi:hypothetical protein
VFWHVVKILNGNGNKGGVKDVGNGEGSKSNGDGAKRAIARRRAMAGPIYKIK